MGVHGRNGFGVVRWFWTPSTRRSELTTNCGKQDLNLHGIATTRPSTWRVCQFRHSRGGIGSLRVFAAAFKEVEPGHGRGPAAEFLRTILQNCEAIIQSSPAICFAH